MSGDRCRPHYHNRLVRRLMRHHSQIRPADQFLARATLVAVGLRGFSGENSGQVRLCPPNLQPIIVVEPSKVPTGDPKHGSGRVPR